MSRKTVTKTDTRLNIRGFFIRSVVLKKRNGIADAALVDSDDTQPDEKCASVGCMYKIGIYNRFYTYMAFEI